MQRKTNQESLGDLYQKRLRGHLPKANLKSRNRRISSIEQRFYKMKFLAKLIKDKLNRSKLNTKMSFFGSRGANTIKILKKGYKNTLAGMNRDFFKKKFQQLM